MNRRQFLKTTIATTVVGAAGVGLLVLSGPDGKLLTLDTALEQLKTLDSNKLVSKGEWDVAQIFNHCAQSVEYSMTGYPNHKSALFKNTVGPLAFGVFALKGSMNHGLSEPIPGAPTLAAKESVELALARLQKSLSDFNRFNGRLAPHFAYGEMTKQQYALAHVMHLNQHLQQVNG